MSEGDRTLSMLRAAARVPVIPLDTLDAPFRLAPGTRLDEFEIVGPLGEGGMGVVYLAHDVTLDRDVAIKLLRDSWQGDDSDDGTVRALEREARATARLSHPGIVTLYRVGSCSSMVYLALEFLEGETLAARLDRGPVAAAEALSYMVQVCDALEYAHRQGIVHRDLKPGNILVDRRGRVRVLDFGISRVAPTSMGIEDPQGAGGRTLARCGTPAYMAPEQWRGEPADARTDIFAAGVVLFELISGKLPHDRSSAPPPDAPQLPRSRDPLVAAIEPICARALAHARDARFETAGEMRDQLLAVASTHRPRRRRAIAVGAAAVVALGAAVAVAAPWVSDPPPDPDLNGHWRADSEGFGGCLLTRIGPRSYYLFGGAGESGPHAYRNHGVMTVRRRGERVVLEGKLADIPGWCCGNVGTLELEIENASTIRVLRSAWGPTHDNYLTLHPQYLLRRDP